MLGVDGVVGKRTSGWRGRAATSRVRLDRALLGNWAPALCREAARLEASFDFSRKAGCGAEALKPALPGFDYQIVGTSRRPGWGRRLGHLGRGRS